MWPLPQNNYNYLRQQWCLHVRSSVRTHVRTYVRTHVCTYTPHVRSYRVSVVQSGQFKICIRALGRTKIVPHLVPHEALNEALFCTTEKCTTERTTERPNDRTYDRTTERPKAYDRATAIRRTERTCECADVRPTKNTHRVFFIRKNLLWAIFFKFLVGHSMKKLTLTTTVRSECRLSYLFTKACVWHLNALVCLTSTQVNPD